MPKVIFLPNEEFCPEGMVVDAAAGDNLLEVAHNAGVEIHHACDGSCACTTCHVVSVMKTWSSKSRNTTLTTQMRRPTNEMDGRPTHCRSVV